MNRTRFASFSASIVIGACILGGCAKPELTPPPAFAKVDATHGYDYRATTAQGVVIAARKEDNDPRANADFWARAVDLKLERDGYSPDGSAAVAPIETRSGLQGKELRFSRAEDGRAYRYWVALYVTKKKVYVVEAAGDAEDFDAAKDDVEQAMRSLKE